MTNCNIKSQQYVMQWWISNALLPFYDDMVDMEDDLDSYKEDANLLKFSPKDPPIAIATEQFSTITIDTVKIQYQPNQAWVEVAGFEIEWKKEWSAKLSCWCNLSVGNLQDVESLDASLNGLSPSTYWEVLTLDPHPIPEPSNTDQSLIPPTELEATTLNPKYGCSTTFDCLDFCDQREVSVTMKRKKRRTSILSPTRQCTQNDVATEIRTQGGPNLQFLK